MLQSLSKSLVLFGIIVSLAFNIQGQTQEDDISIIKSKIQEEYEGEHKHEHEQLHKHPDFLLSDHPSFLVRYNPLTLTLGSLMWIYQKIVSPQISASCLYTPSCSAYSMDLISEYGIVLGVVLSADRLMRCNRMALYDYKVWEVDPETGKITEGTSYYRINN